MSKEEYRYHRLVNSLYNYIKINDFAGVTLGLSGGIDSALSMVIAADAIGSDKVHALIMPSRYTGADSINNARECSKKSQVKYHEIPIDHFYLPILSNIQKVLKEDLNSVTQENIQARIRAVILMAISNQTNKMVLATSNKSEIYTGYCTIYGDTCGGYAILNDLYKTEVYQLSKWRNRNIPSNSLNNRLNVIPNSILTKEPSAELKHNQKDTDNLPNYKVLDKILKMLIEEKIPIDEIAKQGYEINVIKKIQALFKKSEYKREQLPPGPKFS